jgi:IPT/TIG domain
MRLAVIALGIIVAVVSPLAAQAQAASDASSQPPTWLTIDVVVAAFLFAVIGSLAMVVIARSTSNRLANNTALTGDKALEASRIALGYNLVLAGMVLAFLVAVVSIALLGVAKIGDIVAIVTSVTGIIGTLIASFFAVQAAGAGRSQAMDLAAGNQPSAPTYKIAPVTGPAAGATAVSITGNGLTGVTAVNFGGTPGANLNVVNDGSITVETPPGTAGEVDILLVYVSPAVNQTIGKFSYV